MKPRTRNHLSIFTLLAIFLVSIASELRAQEAKFYRNGFDTRQTSWGIKYYKSKVLSHRWHQHIFHDGEGSECFELNVQAKNVPVYLSHKLPRARALNELTASVWFRSNRPGMTLSLRINFPHQRDPKSGKHLAVFVSGDQYVDFGEWKQLKCSPTKKLINNQIALARNRLKLTEIDTRNAYVDKVFLKGLVDTGMVEYFIDSLEFGPIVSPTMNSEIVQASNETKEEEDRNVIRAQIRQGRLTVDGHLSFPRFIPYQGEQASVIKNTGTNVVWIPRYNDLELMEKLHAGGLQIMATPPQISLKKDDSSRNVGLMPFRNDTAHILYWYLGTRIPPKEKRNLIEWNNQIRDADFQFRRPLVADVVADQRIFSRRIDMQASSKHILNTNISFRQYRDYLQSNIRKSTPGSFSWTWIQTEPSAANSTLLERTRRTPVVVEPEQIRLQVYSAIAAGCRGIGYWTETPLDANIPGSMERRLMLAQLNMELDLLQPFLASGNLVEHIPFNVKREEMRINQRNLDLIRQRYGSQERDRLLQSYEDHRKENNALSRELEASVIRFDGGTLVIPVWYQEGAQFVPGRMVANDAEFIVKGIDQTAAVWEVTTTRVRSIPTERVAGGRKVKLEKFDQTAAILFTSDREIKNKLEERMKMMAARSARIAINLAREKLQRVTEVDQELQNLSVGKKFARNMIAGSIERLDQAEEEIKKGAFHRSYEIASDVMQILRTLQYTYWSDAVRSLGSPMSSPYTTSFQTLPEHWKLIAKLGKSELKERKNLIHSGTFEDIDTMLIEGWKHSQNKIDGIRATAELYTHPHNGKYSLRLVAVFRDELSYKRGVYGTPVKVMTPPVMVRHGEIIHAKGWIKVVKPVTGSVEGLIIHDNQGGPVTSLRWRNKSEWMPFTLVREVHFTGKYSLTIALKGVGEVLIDDMELVSIQPKASVASHEAPESKPPAGNSFYDRSMDLLNRIPRPRFPGRKPQSETPESQQPPMNESEIQIPGEGNQSSEEEELELDPIKIP